MAGHSNTNVISCVAALATLRELQSNRVYEHLAATGSKLIDGLRIAARRRGLPFLVQGIGAEFQTAFTERTEIRNYRDYLSCDTVRLRKIGECFDRKRSPNNFARDMVPLRGPHGWISTLPSQLRKGRSNRFDGGALPTRNRGVSQPNLSVG